MKRTLKRERKELEVVEREAIADRVGRWPQRGISLTGKQPSACKDAPSSSFSKAIKLAGVALDVLILRPVPDSGGAPRACC